MNLTTEVCNSDEDQTLPLTLELFDAWMLSLNTSEDDDDHKLVKLMETLKKEILHTECTMKATEARKYLADRKRNLQTLEIIQMVDPQWMENMTKAEFIRQINRMMKKSFY